MSSYQFSNIGKLLTWSTIHAAPKGFEKYLPYTVAIIELEGGERITAQLADVDKQKLTYGQKVCLTFRQVFVDGEEGIIHYGIKFRLLKP